MFSIFLKTSLRNINALQLGFELWDESGDLVTSPLRLQVTGLPRDVLDHGDDLLVTLGLSLPSTLTQTLSWFLSKKTLENPQPAGAQSSLGSLVQPVMGVYFFTFFLETLHTSLGHLEHLVLVV